MALPQARIESKDEGYALERVLICRVGIIRGKDRE